VLLTATINLYRIDPDGMTPVVQDRTIEAQLLVDGYKLTNASVVSGSYGIASPTAQLSLTSSNGKTFELSRFRIVEPNLLVDADTK